MEPGLEQPFELGPALRLDRGDRGAARGLRERPGEQMSLDGSAL